MTADLRRFDYALEPVRRQRQWKLDSLQADLGRVQREVDEAEHAVAALREQLRTASEQVARGLVARLDPVTHPRALGFLVQLRALIEAGDERVRALHVERERARSACLAQQQKVEVIEHHRDECVAEFALGEEARIASEADRDWLARREWASAEAAGEGKR